MDEQRQGEQLELLYNSSVPIQCMAWKTSQERWTIETGGEKGSGRSMLATRHDDDNDDDDNIFLCYFTLLGWIRSAVLVEVELESWCCVRRGVC